MLINSAYIAGSFGPIEHADLDDWKNTLEVNLFGTLKLTQEVLPHMKKARRGSIVNVNSQVTRKPIAGQAGRREGRDERGCAGNGNDRNAAFNRGPDDRESRIANQRSARIGNDGDALS